MQVTEAIKNLDGQNPRPKPATVKGSGKQKPRAEVTEGEYAAYLAGEYAMIARLVNNGMMQVDYAAELIDKPLSFGESPPLCGILRRAAWIFGWSPVKITSTAGRLLYPGRSIESKR